MCAKKVIFSVASWFGVENGKGFLGLKGFSRKRAECNKVKFNWDQVLSERERERELWMNKADYYWARKRKKRMLLIVLVCSQAKSVIHWRKTNPPYFPFFPGHNYLNRRLKIAKSDLGNEKKGKKMEPCDKVGCCVLLSMAIN